jgi:predicted helicase
MFPLYIRDELHPERPIQNFREDAVRPLAEALAFESGNVIENSRSLLNYIYAILHSPAYRALYGEELKQGFPKVPMTDVPSLARGLTDLGDQLVRNHLFDSSIRTFASPEGVRFAGRGAARVEKGYPQWDNGRVTISGERWFEEVPENVWVFQIGGYQVCEKWLKDRRFDKLDRTLNEDDILHYRRIVVALGETIRLMAEIDRVIDEHGGWPGAFKGMTD